MHHQPMRQFDRFVLSSPRNLKQRNTPENNLIGITQLQEKRNEIHLLRWGYKLEKQSAPLLASPTAGEFGPLLNGKAALPGNAGCLIPLFEELLELGQLPSKLGFQKGQFLSLLPLFAVMQLILFQLFPILAVK